MRVVQSPNYILTKNKNKKRVCHMFRRFRHCFPIASTSSAATNLLLLGSLLAASASATTTTTSKQKTTTFFNKGKRQLRQQGEDAETTEKESDPKTTVKPKFGKKDWSKPAKKSSSSASSARKTNGQSMPKSDDSASLGRFVASKSKRKELEALQQKLQKQREFLQQQQQQLDRQTKQVNRKVDETAASASSAATTEFPSSPAPTCEISSRCGDDTHQRQKIVDDFLTSLTKNNSTGNVEFRVKESAEPIVVPALKSPVFGAEYSLEIINKNKSKSNSGDDENENETISFPSFSLLDQDAARNKSKFRVALAAIILKSEGSKTDESEGGISNLNNNNLALIRLLCSPKHARSQATVGKEPLVFLSWFDILFNNNNHGKNTLDWNKIHLNLTCSTTKSSAVSPSPSALEWICSFSYAPDENGPCLSVSSPCLFEAVLALTRAAHSTYFPNLASTASSSPLVSTTSSVSESFSRASSSSVLHYNTQAEKHRFIAPSENSHQSINMRTLLQSILNFYFGNIQPLVILTSSANLFKTPQEFPQKRISFLSVVGLCIERGGSNKSNKSTSTKIYRNDFVNLKTLSSILPLHQQQDPFLNQQEFFSLAHGTDEEKSSVASSNKDNNNTRKGAIITIIPLGLTIAHSKKQAERSAIESVIRLNFSSLLVFSRPDSAAQQSESDFSVDKAKFLVSLMSKYFFCSWMTHSQSSASDSSSSKNNNSIKDKINNDNSNPLNSRALFENIYSEIYGTASSTQTIVQSGEPTATTTKKQPTTTTISAKANTEHEEAAVNQEKEEEKHEGEGDEQVVDDELSESGKRSTTTTTTTAERNIVTATFSDVPHELYIQQTPSSSCLLPFYRNQVNNLLSTCQQKDNSDDDFVIDEKITSSKGCFECSLFVNVANKTPATSASTSTFLASSSSCSSSSVPSTSLSCELFALLAAYKNAYESLLNKKVDDVNDIDVSPVLETATIPEATPPNVAFAPLNLKQTAKNLVHYFFGMSMEIQAYTTNSYEDDLMLSSSPRRTGEHGDDGGKNSIADKIEITMKVTAAAPSSPGKKYVLAKLSSREFGHEEMERKCLSLVMEQVSSFSSSFSSSSSTSPLFLDLVALHRGEKQIVFHPLPLSTRTTTFANSVKNKNSPLPSFDVMSLCRLHLNLQFEKFYSLHSASSSSHPSSKPCLGGWALALRSTRTWHSSKDQVDVFSSRIVVGHNNNNNVVETSASESSTSVLSPIFQSLAFSNAATTVLPTIDCYKDYYALLAHKINQVLDSVTPAHLVNLSALAQRLCTKIFALRIVETVESIQLPGTTGTIWYVRLYLDSQSSDLTVHASSSNITVLDKVATDSLLTFEDEASTTVVGVGSRGCNESKSQQCQQVAWLHSSSLFSPNTSASISKLKSSQLVNSAATIHKGLDTTTTAMMNLNRYTFTGCASRDFIKKLAETKAIFRFLCANFSPDCFTLKTTKNSNLGDKNDGDWKEIIMPAISGKFIQLLQSEKPELYNAIKNSTVQDEYDMIRTEARYMMKEKKNEKHSREIERERLLIARTTRTDFHNNISERDDEGDFGNEQRLQLRTKKQQTSTFPAKIHHHSLSPSQTGQRRQQEIELMKRFRRGSRFDKFEQDHFGTPSLNAVAASNEDVDDDSQRQQRERQEEKEKGEDEDFSSSPSSSVADRKSHRFGGPPSQILDATPIKNVLKAALREERNEALRVKETRFGSQGSTVTLFAIPFASSSTPSASNSDDVLLDLSGEVELGSETESNGQKALAMVCYRVLQEKFPERLISAVSENPNLLDSVLG